MQTRAAVLFDIGQPFQIETLDLAPPRSGEVLVRMQAAGVCHSDWHLVTGDTRHPLPVVAGHEGAGVIEQVGEGVEHVRVGDHVALNWAPACGSCFYCTHGRPCLCDTWTEPIWNGVLLDGSTRLSRTNQSKQTQNVGTCIHEPVYHFCGLACFADHAVVPAASCVVMPKALDPTVSALIGCAVTTGVGAVVNTAKVQAGESATVFGAGGVGLSVVMALSMAGASPIVVIDRMASRCDMAGEFGATHPLVDSDDTTRESLAKFIRQICNGRGSDYVFEAVGSPAVQELCLEAVRPGGTVIYSGLAPMGSATNLSGAIITRKELAILGSYYGTANPPIDFPQLAQWFTQGRLPVDRLVSRTYDLARINDAFADMIGGAVARGVIVWP